MGVGVGGGDVWFCGGWGRGREWLGQGESSCWGSTSQAKDHSSREPRLGSGLPGGMLGTSSVGREEVKTVGSREEQSHQGSPEAWELGPAAGKSRGI